MRDSTLCTHTQRLFVYGFYVQAGHVVGTAFDFLTVHMNTNLDHL